MASVPRPGAAPSSEQVPGVGHRREGQHALDVRLGERAQVPDHHGEDGQDGHRGRHWAARRWQGLQEHAQQRAEGGRLDPRGHQSGHRGGRALVDVRRPHVEGHAGHLEAEPYEQEAHAPARPRSALSALGETATPGHTGEGSPAETVKERDPVEEERGGEGARYEVLHRRLLALQAVAVLGGQGVHGHRHDLQGHEQRDPLQQETSPASPPRKRAAASSTRPAPGRWPAGTRARGARPPPRWTG